MNIQKKIDYCLNFIEEKQLQGEEVGLGYQEDLFGVMGFFLMSEKSASECLDKLYEIAIKERLNQGQ